MVVSPYGVGDNSQTTVIQLRATLRHQGLQGGKNSTEASACDIVTASEDISKSSLWSDREGLVLGQAGVCWSF